MLYDRDRAALGILMSGCSDFDGISELELEKSLNAHKDMASIFLSYEKGSLLGALSVFAPRTDEAEIGAIVLPSARRKGIFSHLFAESDAELRRFDYASELFVVDGRSKAGKEAALSFGACHEYTEYAMRHSGAVLLPLYEGLSIVRMGEDSIEALVDLRYEAFDGSREDTEKFEHATFAAANRQIYGAFFRGILVGVCSLGFEGREVSLNGLVIAREHRGKGLGQAFLGALVTMLSDKGHSISLEVNSQNESAFHLYKKLGFSVTRSVEYYRRPIR
jgi:ribosomal protein S18 acetylase RimI-like enzyme